MKAISRYAGRFVGSFIFVLLGGCSVAPEQQEDVTVGCDVITTMQIDDAFQQAKENMSRSECTPFYSANFAALREIAKGNAHVENRSKFAAWLKYVSDRGVISVRQAKDGYNRYFNETFVSLPSQGHICGHMNKRNPVKAMSHELSQKSEGYNDILGDSEGYNRVHAQYNDMRFMLESVKTACNG